MAELESRLGAPPIDGYTLGQLEAGARDYGAHTLGVETTVENLRLRAKPFACIAHLTRDHFVLITDIDDTSATIIDPPQKKSVPLDTLGALWDRKALLISTAPLAREEDLPRPVSWRAWAFGTAAVALVAATLFALRARSTVTGSETMK